MARERRRAVLSRVRRLEGPHTHTAPPPPSMHGVMVMLMRDGLRSAVCTGSQLAGVPATDLPRRRGVITRGAAARAGPAAPILESTLGRVAFSIRGRALLLGATACGVCTG